MLWVGIFVTGICASAAAAFYVPRAKKEWPVSDKPKVKVTIKLGDK